MKTKILISKLDLHDDIYDKLKNRPFLTVSKLARLLHVRYDKMKEILQKFENEGKVFSVYWWTNTVFFVDDWEDPNDRSVQVFLQYRDRVIEKIEKTKNIRNCYGVQEFCKTFELCKLEKIPKKFFGKSLPSYPRGIKKGPSICDQILLKYLHLWIIVNKILLLEHKRQKENEVKFSHILLDKRIMELTKLFYDINKFLDRYYLDSSVPVTGELIWLANDLDEWYDAYLHRYNQLRSNRLSIGTIITTANLSILQTPKDAAKKCGLTLDQIHNRIKPFVDEQGEPNWEKLNKAMLAETADDKIFADYGDIGWLFYIFQARQQLKQERNSRGFKEIVKKVKQVFPEITVDV